MLRPRVLVGLLCCCCTFSTASAADETAPRLLPGPVRASFVCAAEQNLERR